jgi:hypothetical protein
MPELKLAKLPDRTPVRITITVSPELNQALRQYAGLYRATYGQAEAVAELIPFMLGAFLDSDKGFAKARKGTPLDVALVEPERRRRGRRPVSQPPSSASTEE